MELPITLLARYLPLDGVVLGPILRGYPTRTTFSVQSDQGRFIVKMYDDEAAFGLVRPAAEEFDRRLYVFEYLAGKGFGHAPGLLRTRAGEPYIRVDGKTIYVLEEIEGTTPPSVPGTWAELGRLAAVLNAYADYPYAYAVPVEGTIAELTRKAERYPFAREFLEQVRKLRVLVDQPTCLIHAEINLANSMLSSAGRLYLLDWDEAGRGPWALEAGYPLLIAFLGEDLVFQGKSAAAFYDAYTSGADLSTERGELIFTAALLHALRYLEFGDPLRRWAKIRFALDHKDKFLSAIVKG